MRFLVLGASGFIGRHLRSLLENQQIETVGTQSRNVSSDLVPFDLAENRVLDFVPESFFQQIGPCYVVHCTGFGSPDKCVRQIQASHKVTVTGLRRLVEDLSHFGVRHVYLSTSYVFDGETGGYLETDPCNPICEYGRQKVEVETFLRTFHPESLILRLDKVVGDNPGERHLFSEFKQLLSEGRPIRCIRSQTMSPIFVDDVAKVIVEACERGLRGLCHLAGMETFERIALAKKFQEISALPGEIVEADRESFQFADPRPLHSDLNGQMLREAMGFQPTPVEQILKQFVSRE